MNTREESIYRAAVAADQAWQAELDRRFGRSAGDVRYTDRGKGELGSELRRLYSAAVAAGQAWDPISRNLAGYCPWGKTIRYPGIIWTVEDDCGGDAIASHLTEQSAIDHAKELGGWPFVMSRHHLIGGRVV